MDQVVFYVKKRDRLLLTLVELFLDAPERGDWPKSDQGKWAIFSNFNFPVFAVSCSGLSDCGKIPIHILTEFTCSISLTCQTEHQNRIKSIPLPIVIYRYVCMEAALRGIAHYYGRSYLAWGRGPSIKWVQCPNPAVPSILQQALNVCVFWNNSTLGS